MPIAITKHAIPVKVANMSLAELSLGHIAPCKLAANSVPPILNTIAILPIAAVLAAHYIVVMPSKNKQIISPGHNACAGCGQLIAARAASRAFDQKTIIINATGCLEVTTTSYPQSAWDYLGCTRYLRTPLPLPQASWLPCARKETRKLK